MGAVIIGELFAGPVAKQSSESKQKNLCKIFWHQHVFGRECFCTAGHIADKPSYSLLVKNVNTLAFYLLKI